MGKNSQNKTKKQQEKHDPGHDRSRNNFDPQTSIAERDAIEEKAATDLISTLPDDVLQYIISLLPLRDEVRTSFLSTKWKGLWKKGLPITYGTVDEIYRQIGNFVDDGQELGLSIRGQEFRSILSRIKHCRRFLFYFGNSSFLVATKMPNGTLHLDFCSNKYESPIDSDLHLKTAYYYRLQFYTLGDLGVSPSRSIRTLHLRAVTNLTSGAVCSILLKFQSLESLKIEQCRGLRSLIINIGDLFKHLTILNCPHLKSLHIKARNLDKFWFRGLLPSSLCPTIGDPYTLPLSDAMLDFRGGPGYDDFTNKHSESLLSAIISVRILTLCRRTFEIDPTSYSRPRTRKYSRKYSAQDFDCRRLDFLEVVQLEGVIEHRDGVLLTNRLLDVATKKTKIIVKSYENRIWKLEEVSLSRPRQLCKGSRGSPEGKKHYMFVEVNEGEESGKLCSKYPHADL